MGRLKKGIWNESLPFHLLPKPFLILNHYPLLWSSSYAVVGKTLMRFPGRGALVARSLSIPWVRLAPPYTTLPRTGEPAAKNWREETSFNPHEQKGQDLGET